MGVDKAPTEVNRGSDTSITRHPESEELHSRSSTCSGVLIPPTPSCRFGIRETGTPEWCALSIPRPSTSMAGIPKNFSSPAWYWEETPTLVLFGRANIIAVRQLSPTHMSRFWAWKLATVLGSPRGIAWVLLFSLVRRLNKQKCCKKPTQSQSNCQRPEGTAARSLRIHGLTKFQLSHVSIGR